VAAAIGIAIGSSLYMLAIFAAFLTILIFSGFGLIEGKIIKAKNSGEK